MGNLCIQKLCRVEIGVSHYLSVLYRWLLVAIYLKFLLTRVITLGVTLLISGVGLLLIAFFITNIRVTH